VGVSSRLDAPSGAPSSFVGRAADLAAIAGRFDDGARLVTITGLGGMGRARVAQQYAAAHAASYAAPGGGGVSTLRNLGLRPLLVSSAAGDALTSAIPCVLGSDE